MRQVLQNPVQAALVSARDDPAGVQGKVGLQKKPELGGQSPFSAAQEEDAGDPALEKTEKRIGEIAYGLENQGRSREQGRPGHRDHQGPGQESRRVLPGHHLRRPGQRRQGHADRLRNLSGPEARGPDRP